MKKRLPTGLSISNLNDRIIAILYETKIVEINQSEKTIQLSFGNRWKNNHTKKCINLVLENYGITVFQRQNKWYIDVNGRNIGCFDKDVIIRFSNSFDEISPEIGVA